MLTSVYFYDEMSLMATKVNDVVADDLLAIKLYRVRSKILIPKFVLLRRCVSA